VAGSGYSLLSPTGDEPPTSQPSPNHPQSGDDNHVLMLFD
jgi:hypothetical protein